MKKKKHKASRKTRTRAVRREDMSIAGEVSYIISRAQAEDSRVVSLGPLVFFSSATGDAWVLEPEGRLALCLARAGEPLQVEIQETPETFAIGWTSEYRIEGGHFIYWSSDGRETAVYGYPTAQIERQSTEPRNL